MSAQCRVNNPFPKGECTWYASQRMHELTGCFVPWDGNAKDWVNNAPSFGWIVQLVPVIAAIICLQPGVQLADGTFGHVAVVESVRSDGACVCSTMNWGTTAAQRQSIRSVTFFPGKGVSFITNGRDVHGLASNTAPSLPSSGVLSAEQVSQAALAAGFTGSALDIAVAIAKAESGFRVDAINNNTNGSTDRGLWQINSVHSQYDPNRLLSDPVYNATAAFQISSSGTNFTPWTTFNTGAYKQFLGLSDPNAGNPGNQAGKTVEITLKEWLASMLTQLRNDMGVTNVFGAGPSQKVANFCTAWAMSLGGSNNFACQFNCLLSVVPEQGSMACGGTNALPGVQSYADVTTATQATVTQLKNSFGALAHALATNDEGNLGLTVGTPMAANIAADLCQWAFGSRSLNVSYLLTVLRNSGISSASIVGGNASGGAGVSQETIDTWGNQVIGQSFVPDTNPLDQLQASLAGVGTFFTNLTNFLTNPMRLVKIIAGGAMVMAGLFMAMKVYLPQIAFPVPIPTTAPVPTRVTPVKHVKAQPKVDKPFALGA